MKLIIIPALAAATLCSLIPPGVSAGQTMPTLTLSEACDPVVGQGIQPELRVTVTGVAPFAPVSGSIQPPSGSVISGTVFANDLGVSSIGVLGGRGLYIVTITSPFTAVQSFTVRCLPKDTAECKNGGWQSYGIFKNQGDCVSFIATGDKNPPATSPSPAL
jgi:hypothetical protein